MEDKIDKLEYQISQLKKQLNNVHIAYREKEYECKQYQELVSAVNAVQDKEHEYWAWQPDENNHLESLICPVVIPAEWLRNMLDEVHMKGMADAYKLRDEFKHHN